MAEYSDDDDEVMISDEEDPYYKLIRGSDEEPGSDIESIDEEDEGEDEVLEEEEGEPAEESKSERAQDNTLDKDIIIIEPEERMSPNILSKFEMTELVSIRATQIAQTGICMVDIGSIDDPVRLAKKELMARKCPLMLKREVGEVRDKITGRIKVYVECWSPNTMTFATVYTDV